MPATALIVRKGSEKSGGDTALHDQSKGEVLRSPCRTTSLNVRLRNTKAAETGETRSGREKTGTRERDEETT